MAVFSFDASLSSDCAFVSESVDAIGLARRFDGRSLRTGWSAPSVELKRMAYSDGDFHPFFLNAPVLEAHAVRALEPVLGGLVEFLPLRCAGRTLSVLNVTNMVDALDIAASEPTFDLSGAVARVRRFVFDPRRIASSLIFKVPEFALERVFVTDEFVAEVERAGLQRARFRATGPDEWPTRAGAADPDFVKHPVQVQDGGSGASLASIETAERRCGLRFPDGLKWLFSNANGARLENSLGDCLDCLALGDGRGSAEWTYALLVLQKGFAPRTWFPFASIFGEVVFADCAEQDGTAFVWRHDTSHEPLEPMGWSVSDLARACQRRPG